MCSMLNKRGLLPCSDKSDQPMYSQPRYRQHTTGWQQLAEQSGLIRFKTVKEAREYNFMRENNLESIYTFPV